jgi:hypothetical protein
MTAPLRGTQSLVGQMGWVLGRPWLLVAEISWRWIFGIPFLAACWVEAQRILSALPPAAAGLNGIDPQNPWMAAGEIAHSWALYQPHVRAVLLGMAPGFALGWVVISGLGRALVLHRMDAMPERRMPFRPLGMMVLQVAWLVLLGAVWWGWWGSMAWAASTHVTAGAEPDLIGFAMWAIFLSLGFFTAWALVSWPLTIAPLLMLLEERSALGAIAESRKLGKALTSKLVETNLVMGIVTLALIVLAMVLSAAPLPFSDELGAETLHQVSMLAVVFYLVASDYFQLVRLKGSLEFWKMYRGDEEI